MNQQSAVQVRVHATAMLGIPLLLSLVVFLSFIACVSDDDGSQVHHTNTFSTSLDSTYSSQTEIEYFEDWESGDESEHPWFFGGHIAPEVVETNEDVNTTMDSSEYCLRFGNVSTGEYSQFGFAVAVTEESWVSFQYKVETDDSSGYLVLYSGEAFSAEGKRDEDTGLPQIVIQPSEIFYKSGFTTWKETTITLPVGVYDLAWRFEKTGDTIIGEDTAWIDNINFGSGVVAYYPAEVIGLFLEIQGSSITIDGVDIALERKMIVLTNSQTLDVDLYCGIYESDGSHKVIKGYFNNSSLFGTTLTLRNDYQPTINYGNSTEDEFSFYSLTPAWVIIDIYRSEPGERRHITLTVPYNSADGTPFVVNMEWNPDWENPTGDPLPTVENDYQDKVLWELPDTGQTTVYATGDDGSYESNEKNNYADNGDGSITDTVTNLMWQKNGSTLNEAVDWGTAYTYCDELSLATYEDWRMPSSSELVSIVDFSKVAPAINTMYFTNTKTGSSSSSYDDVLYWTATQNLKDASSVWVVWSDDGMVTSASKTLNTGYVRCVR